MMNDFRRSNEKMMSELWKKPFRFSSIELSSVTSNFDTKIGFDEYGRVYKGQLPTGVDVAVKVLLVPNVEEMTFMTAVNAIDRTYHRNLVKLYGFCFDDKVKALVSEYMGNGSLEYCLLEKHLNIKWEKLYDIAVETAKGLSYLHDGCEEQIIHGDMKPSSVFLDSNLCPKIGDFGLSRILKRDPDHGIGPFGYAAPETYSPSSERSITEKCDVYSFGILLFEVLLRRKKQRDWVLFPRKVWQKLQNGHLNELIIDCGITKENREKASILCLIALWCVQIVPQNRPSMNTVVNMLRREIHVIPVPPDPFWAVNLSGLTFSHEVIYSNVSPAIDRVQDKKKLGESAVDSIDTHFGATSG